MTFARATSLLIAALVAAGCTLTLDADDGNFCNAAGQCPGGLRCVGSKCIESGPVCGDYEVDAGEECDGGGVNPGGCEYGQLSCTGCSADCRQVAGATSYCGDGAIDGSNGETCDEGAANSDAPDAACRTDCTPKRCGDEIVDSGEVCDLGKANLASCPDYLPTPPASGICSTGCQELCPATGYCGDGATNAAHGETCDLGADNGVCGQTCSRDCAAWSCDREWCWWTPAQELAPDARYDVSVAGIAKDSLTGLTWQRAQAVGTYTWTNAKTYCTGLSLAGLSGWRLPTYNELLSIVDYSRYSPALNVTAFPGTSSSYFWASSPSAGGASSAWVVDFVHGGANKHDQSNTNYVRCVR